MDESLTILQAKVYDYEALGEPTVSINPDKTGVTWLSLLTGELFVCIDNTTDDNAWVGQRDTLINVTNRLPKDIYNSSVEYFSGTNGDPANPDLWTSSYGGADVNIQNNTLELNSNSSTDKVDYYNSKFTISGDFEVVQWLRLQGAPTASSTNYIGIRILSNEGSGAHGQMHLVSNSNSITYFQGDGSDWTWTNVDGKGNYIYQKMKIVRRSGVWRLYYYDAISLQWEWNGNRNGQVVVNGDTTDVYLQTYHRLRGGSNFVGDIDQIMIIADAINWGVR